MTYLPTPLEPWNATRAKLAVLEATSWLGTPHRDRIAIKGKGIDCLNLMREIYVAAGILPRFKFPYYNTRLGVGLDYNVMEWAAGEVFYTTKVTNSQYRLGDLVIFRVGHQSNHVAVLLDAGQIYHSASGCGVRTDHLEVVEDEIQSVLRFTSTGIKRNPETVNLREQVERAKNK